MKKVEILWVPFRGTCSRDYPFWRSVKLKDKRRWLRNKRSSVSFVLEQTDRRFCLVIGRAGRIFRFAPDVRPCACMAAKKWTHRERGKIKKL